MTRSARLIGLTAVLLCTARGALAADNFDVKAFLGFDVVDARASNAGDPKTLFQTNSSYDSRIAIPVDGVIVHQHGTSAERIAAILKSWSQQGFLPQRMFFADSDAGNHYTQGRFDGREHFEDIELDKNGKRVLCANVRPYMLPTKGWTEYLKTQVKYSIDGGAAAIYPEEPLAHNYTGYEESFKKAFAKEYGMPWQGGHVSPDAFFKTAKLKNKLYIQLEQDLCDYTTKYAAAKGSPIDFLIPIHSIFSNLSARLVAPLGTSLRLKGHKGYIGQIWTGPVRWTIGQCSNKEITFFDSAYVNYDYFANLVADSELVLYLLADPVEDDPRFKWDEYGKWYKECLAAKLMFPAVSRYEVMPWPDRIFLPGYSIGGGTPGPAPYRTVLMSCLTALQNMPPGARRDVAGGTKGIGMIIGDSAMWQNSNRPVQDPFMGLLIPALKKGIPVSSVPIERSGDADYMKNFRLLMLSYEGWKPQKKTHHDNLLRWVRNGGLLLVFDTKDTFDGIDMFWKQQGFASPQAQLLNKLGVSYAFAGDNISAGDVSYFHRSLGRGHVVVSSLSPKTFVDKTVADEKYLPLLRACFAKHIGQTLDEPRFLTARRGDFLIAHTFDTARTIDGTFIDIFDENLPVVENPHMPPNTSQILFDISDKISDATPRLLYTTYRLMGKNERPNETTFFIAGPAGTRGRARLYAGYKKLARIEARTKDGKPVPTSFTEDPDTTVLIEFPYNPHGTGFRVTWQ